MSKEVFLNFLKRNKNKKRDTTASDHKKNELSSDSKRNKDIVVQEKPKICLIDIDDCDFKFLQSKGFNCTSGTLGNPVEVPKKYQHEEHQCLLNFDIPPNLHEYDIVVVSLQTSKTIPYKQSDHTHSQVKGGEEIFMLSKFPQTVFDPRPFSAFILKNKCSDLQEKESIIIAFACEKECVEYEPALMTQRGLRSKGKLTKDTYSFLESLPSSDNVTGRETEICHDLRSEMTKVLTKHNDDCTYAITFDHPKIWKDSKKIKCESFHPLMQTSDGRIISFADLRSKPYVFIFPLIKRKKEFLVELFQNVLPSIFPKIFPYCTQFSWLKDEAYQLPNEKTLLTEKKQLKTKYTEKIGEVKGKIDANHEKYSFLHDLLTQTSDELVKTVENYFRWLEFVKVTNMDEANSGLREEDLQVQLDNGLLVAEVKGIGGTSTDGECSQISKVKYRRARERNSFDVYALYIVNHQRYLPPKERMNPPFNTQQIQDAKNDERGLVSTYELFKLYFNIDSGVITKEDARKALLQHGLVTFTPSNSVRIGYPLEIHHNGLVAILKIEGVTLSKGATIIICDEQKFRCSKIIDIQFNDRQVESISDGEIGVELNTKISQTSELWLKQS